MTNTNIHDKPNKKNQEVWLPHFFGQNEHLTFGSERGDLSEFAFWHIDMNKPQGHRRIGKTSPFMTAPSLVEWAVKVLSCSIVPKELADIGLPMFCELVRGNVRDSEMLNAALLELKQKEASAPKHAKRQDTLLKGGSVEVGGIILSAETDDQGNGFMFSSEAIPYDTACKLAAVVLRDALTKAEDPRFFMPWLTWKEEVAGREKVKIRTAYSLEAKSHELCEQAAPKKEESDSPLLSAAALQQPQENSDAQRLALYEQLLKLLFPVKDRGLNSALYPLVTLEVQNLQEQGVKSVEVLSLAQLAASKAQIQTAQDKLLHLNEQIKQANACLAEATQQAQEQKSIAETALTEANQQLASRVSDLERRERELLQREQQIAADRAAIEAELQKVVSLQEEVDKQRRDLESREARANKIIADHACGVTTVSSTATAVMPTPKRTWGKSAVPA